MASPHLTQLKSPQCISDSDILGNGNCRYCTYAFNTFDIIKTESLGRILGLCVVLITYARPTVPGVEAKKISEK